MDGKVVPWYDSKEWFTAYSHVFSSSIEQKAEAIKLLSIWKARCPSLPSGIESTLGLLQVQYEDLVSSHQMTGHHILRFAYSSAIMRFVNHMLDSESKGASLYRAANQLGVPDWIIDLRHDTAHNNSLPTLELLREATLVAMEWLHENYWDAYKKVIKDYMVSEKQEVVVATSDSEDKITLLIHLYTSLSICSCRVKKISEITDDDMRESLIVETRELIGANVSLNNLETMSIKVLITLINTQSKKLLKRKHSSSIVCKALVEENSLFLSYDLLVLLGDEEFKRNKLNNEYVNCFKVLLKFLHTNDLIMDLVMELISLTKNTTLVERTRRLAAIWIREILKGLRKSRLFLDKINKTHINSVMQKNNLDLLFQHWYPNEKNGLYLDLKKRVPQELTELGFVQPIILAYNPYLTYFVKDLLYLLQPPLPKMAVENICCLAKVISDASSKQSNGKIYTVEDLQSIYKHPVNTVDHSDSNTMEGIEEITEHSNVHYEMEYEITNHIWTLASAEHNWAACPVGVLPWQQNVAEET